MIACKICGKEFEKPVQLTTHIQYNHKDYTGKSYYDEFCKKPNEGICKICGKPTQYITILSGYKTYCSRKCVWQDDEIKQKRANTIDKLTEEEKREWRAKILRTIHANSTSGITKNAILVRQQKSEEHFKQYFDKCNCTFVKYENKHVTFTCNVCHTTDTFVRSLIDRYARTNDYAVCHCCNTRYCSKQEQELTDFIKSFYSKTILLRNKSLIGKELDIVLPDDKIAIEYDGLYWHNENVIENTSHLTKTELCEKQGYQLIHIFSDEWLFKRDIVKSRLKTLLHNSTRIFARKCKVHEVDSKTATSFLNTNHIQGACASKYKYGLYYNGELVSIMTFGKSRFANEFELLRFCNKLDTCVIGGASKLLQHFLNEHTEITEITSYADRRWSKGNLYEKLNFVKTSVTKPSYFYVIRQKRENRIKYQKHKLVAAGFDSTKTEHEIMKERGIPRIYDCGTIKYVLKQS